MNGMNPFLASSMLQKQLQSSSQSQGGLNDIQQGGGGSAGGGAGRSAMAAAMAGLPLSPDHLQLMQNAGIAFQHQQNHQHRASLSQEAQASALANEQSYHLLQQLQQLQQLQEMKQQQQRQLSGESSGSTANGSGNSRSKDETNSAASAMIELLSGINETSPAQRSVPSKSAFGRINKESIKNKKKLTIATSRATAVSPMPTAATATLTCKPVAQGGQGQPQDEQGKQQQVQQQQQQQQLPRNTFPTVPCRARGMPIDHSFKVCRIHPLSSLSDCPSVCLSVSLFICSAIGAFPLWFVVGDCVSIDSIHEGLTSLFPHLLFDSHRLHTFVFKMTSNMVKV